MRRADRRRTRDAQARTDRRPHGGHAGKPKPATTNSRGATTCLRATNEARAAEPLRSRITVDGADRAPHRTFLRAMGLDDEAIAKPFVGVMSTHGENTPCSLSLATAGRSREDGRRHGRRHAVRVHHGVGIRRRLDEPSRHAHEPHVARADRRLHRTGDARPCLRCPGRLRRLRQDPARDHDGDGPAELPVGVHVRRRHAAGPVRGQARQHASTPTRQSAGSTPEPSAEST